MNQTRIYATSYVVSVLPEGFQDSSTWDLRVEMRGKDKWCVSHKGRVFSKSQQRKKIPEPIYEVRPSERSESFRRTYYFDLDYALNLAGRLAPKIVMSGMTPAQAIEQFPMEER